VPAGAPAGSPAAPPARATAGPPAEARPEATVPVPPPGISGHGDARHCWVLGLPEAPGRWPGLLVEWRRGAQGWEGRVVLALPGSAGVVLVERWLDPVHLEPR
jgi:hypothetical protein